MSVYSRDGTELALIYARTGEELAIAYDVHGTVIYEAQESDYDQYSTEYQHTILQARDAWKTEYRADEDVIPVFVTTDQHKYLNSAHKPLFDYLKLALKWTEVSAIINLGDVCGAVYNSTDLNNMKTCLTNIPASKQINVAGNHDCQLNKEEGSSYAYAPLTDELFHVLQDTYMNNSSFGNGNTRYGFKGMESVLDTEHNVRYCIFAIWYTDGNPWYHYYATSEAIEAMISMLSIVDDNDIVILSHIQPYALQSDWYKPAVDGNEASTSSGTRSHIAYANANAIDQMIADRKAKTSGTITDSDGVSHSYDFSGCTSDLLCCLSGHSHTDIYGYSPDDNVPSVTFDAYRYDNVPAYFVNIDRTRERLNVWKFDESNNIYNYQVPFEDAAS